jgi:hypothetical protein
MSRITSRWGAAALVVVAAAYLVASLVTGHSAASQTSPDLTASDAALPPYPAAALLVREQGRVVVIDVRTPAEFRTYHLPASTNVPGAGPRQILAALGDHAFGLVVANGDDAASHLVAEALALDRGRHLHFLQGGPRAFYLTFELPAPLFASAPPPFGYDTAMHLVRDWLATGHTADAPRVLEALGRLAAIDYTPTELGAKKPKPKSGGKRKIAGGCG